MIEFKECEIEGYPARTKENIIKSDITIAFATNFDTRGEILTNNLATRFKKIYIGIDLNELFYSPINTFSLIESKLPSSSQDYIFNIAGNGLYSLKLEQESYNKYVQEVLEFYLKYTFKEIKLVRSGGQTGIDEAGIVAADRLGIPTLVLAPKGWMFRNKEGKDIKNEQLFKQRFI